MRFDALLPPCRGIESRYNITIFFAPTGKRVQVDHLSGSNQSRPTIDEQYLCSSAYRLMVGFAHLLFHYFEVAYMHTSGAEATRLTWRLLPSSSFCDSSGFVQTTVICRHPSGETCVARKPESLEIRILVLDGLVCVAWIRVGAFSTCVLSLRRDKKEKRPWDRIDVQGLSNEQWQTLLQEVEALTRELYGNGVRVDLG